MTTREKHIAQKRKELERLCKQQIRLITKALKIAAKPCKRQSTALRRIGQSLAIGFQVRMIEAQKQMIMAQPIPNYVPGGVVPGGIAIVGESDRKEIIITPDGTITTSNQHPHPHQLPAGPIRPVPGIDKEPDV
jgi:hypothetical protein